MSLDPFDNCIGMGEVALNTARAILSPTLNSEFLDAFARIVVSRAREARKALAKHGGKESMAKHALKRVVEAAVLGPVQDLGVKIVLSRDLVHVGAVVGGPYRCRLAGCRGMTYRVRWEDGALTVPCTEGMAVHNEKLGVWKIV